MYATEILEKDFAESLAAIDFNSPYDPYSREFMKPLFIGMLLTAIKMNENDVEEELDGARKYIDLFNETGDVQYREMAHDELKHAGILIKKHLAKADEKERVKLNEKERERMELMKLVKVEV